MECEVLVIAEHSRGEFDPITFELIHCAAKIARTANWRVAVLVLGADLTCLVERLKREAVDFVLFADEPKLGNYSAPPHARAAAEVARRVSARLVLVGHTHRGIEIAAGIGGALNAPVVSNCRRVDIADNKLAFKRPVMKGRFLATIHAEMQDSVVATISKEASFPIVSPDGPPEVVTVAASVTPDSAVTVIETTQAARTEDITKAEVIVAVGRGIKSPIQLGPFQDLAGALGAALAASRPLVDSGWLTSDHQVGLSGVTVRPKVYLAFGISGAAQHIAGMKQSSLIIAINNDPSAPVFQVAHCGAVADMFEIAPALLERAKLALANASGAAILK